MQKKESWDYFKKSKVAFLQNIIDEKKILSNKKIVPYGAHWIFFNENFNNKELGSDGHPKRGQFFPLLKGYKRMFAGANLVFKKKIFFDDKIKKISEINSFTKKKSNKKNIFFLKLTNIYLRNNAEVLRELQTIAFVKNDHSSNSIKNNSIGLSLIYKKTFKFDNINLFRYSALTYNSHRIHYDLDYTKNVEGHRNLLVHGPLIATIVLNELCNITKYSINEFNFTIHKPIFVNEKVVFKFYFSKLDKSRLIAKVFKSKSVLAFKSEIKLNNQAKFSKG
tara:strand:+ start:30 stop:866 length:837 start_codon:yes stop_codon:yes gene_type:complete